MDFKCRQVLGALVLLSSSPRDKYDESVNIRIIELLTPLLPLISLEGIRWFLKDNPAVCSEIKCGRNKGLMLFDQPVIVLLFYAFYNIKPDLRLKLPMDLQNFFNINFKIEIDS